MLDGLVQMKRFSICYLLRFPLAGMQGVAPCSSTMVRSCRCPTPCLPSRRSPTGDPSQEVSTGKGPGSGEPYRTLLLVAHTGSLAGQTPKGVQSIRVQPLLGAGGRALCFDVGGIKHQDVFRLCTGFRLCVLRW